MNNLKKRVDDMENEWYIKLGTVLIHKSDMVRLVVKGCEHPLIGTVVGIGTTEQNGYEQAIIGLDTTVETGHAIICDEIQEIQRIKC